MDLCVFGILYCNSFRCLFLQTYLFLLQLENSCVSQKPLNYPNRMSVTLCAAKAVAIQIQLATIHKHLPIIKPCSFIKTQHVLLLHCIESTINRDL